MVYCFDDCVVLYLFIVEKVGGDEEGCCQFVFFQDGNGYVQVVCVIVVEGDVVGMFGQVFVLQLLSCLVEWQYIELVFELFIDLVEVCGMYFIWKDWIEFGYDVMEDQYGQVFVWFCW